MCVVIWTLTNTNRQMIKNEKGYQWKTHSADFYDGNF